MWDGITYPIPNFNGCTTEIWKWMSNGILVIILDVVTYPGMLETNGPSLKCMIF